MDIMSSAAIVNRLREDAATLAEERTSYMESKQRKAKAENEVLKAIVEAVSPALPAISTKMEGLAGPLKRAVDLGGGLFLGEQGDFFSVDSKKSIRCYDVGEVLDKTSLPAILAVLLTSIRAQVGKLDPRTDQIEREANILEGIAAAFKAGGVR